MSGGFARTRAALDVYDKGEAARKLAWDKARTAAHVREAVEADEAADDLVRDAFYEDTKAVNTADHVRVADIAFIKKCARAAP